MQAGELALALDDLGVGVEDLRELAVQADADVVRELRMLRHQSPRGAHDEFEMRDVVAFLRADHEKIVLGVRPPVQSVAAVEHENLERGHAVIDGEMLHFVDVLRLDRSDVVAVIDPEPPVGLLEDFGHERRGTDRRG